MRRTAREVETKESVPFRARPRKTKKRMKKGMEGLDFDPEKVSGSWITPEQFMKILAKEGEKSLAAPVKKLGYWNVDMAYSSPNKAVLLQGTVVDANKKAMPDVQIWAVGKDYYGQSPDKTAADGRFSALMVQFDSTVDVQVQQHVLDKFVVIVVFFFRFHCPYTFVCFDLRCFLFCQFLTLRYFETVKVPNTS